MTRIHQIRVWALASLLALASLRCNGGNVEPPIASDIAPVSGDGQTAGVGQQLPNPLVVVVTDESGNPVSGVTVSWVAQGGGSVSETSVQTGATGRASVQRVLGPDVGEQTTTASVSGLQGSPVTFLSTATDAESPSLTVAQQPSGTAQSGVAFASQPVIQLKDAAGNDLAQNNVEVTASIASGTGTLGGAATRTTNAGGTATFTDLSITGAAGSYTLRFTAPGTNQALSEPIVLAAAAGSIAITTNPPVKALTKEVFDPVVQPEVVVRDGSGAPVAGAEVTVRLGSGNGSLEGKTSATTDASGVAKFGDLGISGSGDHTLEFASGTETVTSSPVTIEALPAEATVGKWGEVISWDIVPLHMTLLPTGKIFAWGKRDVGDTVGMPRIWDPSGGSPGTAQKVTVSDMLFCAGHTLMPDGRLMVSGGHHQDDAGIKATYFFSPDGAGQKGPDMAFGRWYPTMTVLPDGRLLTMAGRDEEHDVVMTPELWEGGQWMRLPGAGDYNVPYYPRNFVAPNGRIFMAGERIVSRWFDVDATGAGGGRGQWTDGPRHIYNGNRDYGTAVMYDPGKILYAGGGGFPGWRLQSPDTSRSTPTATAEKIDLNQSSPQWQSAGSMSGPRRHLNSTILPDGTVLITGGTRGGGVLVDYSDANSMRAAEVWSPATGQWTTLASNQVTRVYHSVSLLLPDGSVLHGASGDAGNPPNLIPDKKNHEIFSPPYLFKGARPTISSAPASVGYGQTFSVATPNAAQITDVRWIRLGSVTHAFDMNQRANTLSFTVEGGAVQVTAPASPNLAPPGHYLLFVLNRNGVPSEGKIVKIQ